VGGKEFVGDEAPLLVNGGFIQGVARVLLDLYNEPFPDTGCEHSWSAARGVAPPTSPLKRTNSPHSGMKSLSQPRRP
jgi:hypothetical protein